MESKNKPKLWDSHSSKKEAAMDRRKKLQKNKREYHSKQRQGHPHPDSDVPRQRHPHPDSDVPRQRHQFHEHLLPNDILPDSSDDCYSNSKISNSSVCNWSEEEDDVTSTDRQLIEHEQLRAADFEYLQNVPKAGNFATFSSEKHWDDDDINIEKSTIRYFTLNLELLNAGLNTIPFYKKLDYESSLFSKDLIRRMNEEAERAEQKYQDVLKEYEDKKSTMYDSRNSSGKKSANASRPSSKPSSAVTNKPPPLSEQQAPPPDELDELLNMTTDSQLPPAAVPANTDSNVIEVSTTNEENKENESTAPNAEEGGEKKDLQEWLDNVLDE